MAGPCKAGSEWLEGMGRGLEEWQEKERGNVRDLVCETDLLQDLNSLSS